MSKLKVLFLCTGNSARSQMAQGFAEVFGGEKVEVYSAGSIPSSQIDPIVIEVMKEKGIDLSSKRPKGLNDLPPIEIDSSPWDARRPVPLSCRKISGI